LTAGKKAAIPGGSTPWGKSGTSLDDGPRNLARAVLELAQKDADAECRGAIKFLAAESGPLKALRELYTTLAELPDTDMPTGLPDTIPGENPPDGLVPMKDVARETGVRKTILAEWARKNGVGRWHGQYWFTPEQVEFHLNREERYSVRVAEIYGVSLDVVCRYARTCLSGPGGTWRVWSYEEIRQFGEWLKEAGHETQQVRQPEDGD